MTVVVGVVGFGFVCLFLLGHFLSVQIIKTKSVDCVVFHGYYLSVQVI